MAFKSIKTKIVVWAGICLAATVAGIVTYSALSVSNTSSENAKTIAVETARLYAENISKIMEAPLVTAQTFAHLLSAAKGKNAFKLDRDNVISMIKMLIENNPNFVGMSTAWEPDAFDGLDLLYTKSLNHDETGRFIPYISRGSQGNIAVEPLIDYEKEGVGDYYLVPKKTKKESIIEPYVYPVQGKDVFMTTLSAPILVNGNFYGIGTVDISLDFIQKLTEKLNQKDFRVSIFSNKGVLAGDSDRPELIGKPVVSTYAVLESSGLMKRIQNGELLQEFHGDHLYICVPIQIGKTDTPWFVLIQIPKKTIQSQGIRMMRNEILIGLIFTVLALILIGFLASGVSKPIEKAVEFSRSVAEGDFTADMEIRQQDETGQLVRAMKDMAKSLKKKTELAERIAVNDLNAEAEVASDKDKLGKALKKMLENLKIRAEIAEERTRFAEAIAAGRLSVNLDVNSVNDSLGAALKNMSENLIAMIRKIKENAAILGSSSEEMSAVSGQLSVSADSMTQQSADAAAAAEQISMTVKTMASGSEQVSAVINSVSATAEQISMSMNAIAVAVEEMTASIANIEKNAGKGAQVTENATELSGKTGSTMRMLAEAAQEIGEVTEVIRRIADQTNMLALNATIEAASAGDAGKGFAVVANEIKELANQSGKAAETIAKRIKGVQKSTDTAVNNIQDVISIISEINEFVKIINLSVGEQAKTTAEISKNMQQSAKASVDLSKSMLESAAAATQLSMNTQEAAKVINDIASRIQNVSQTALDVSSGAKQVSISANDLARIAGDLNMMTDRFKTGDE